MNKLLKNIQVLFLVTNVFTLSFAANGDATVDTTHKIDSNKSDEYNAVSLVSEGLNVGNAYILDRDTYGHLTDGLSPYRENNNTYWVRVNAPFKIFSESSMPGSTAKYPDANYIQLRGNGANNTVYFDRTTTEQVIASAEAGLDGTSGNFSMGQGSVNWTTLSTLGNYYNYTHFEIIPKIDAKEYKLWISGKINSSLASYKNTGIVIKTDGEAPTYEFAEMYFDKNGELKINIDNINDAGSGNREMVIKISAKGNPYLVKTYKQKLDKEDANVTYTINKEKLDQLYSMDGKYTFTVTLSDEVGNIREVTEKKRPRQDGYIYTKIIAPGSPIRHLLVLTDGYAPNDTILKGKIYYDVDANNNIDKSKFLNFGITNNFTLSNIIKLPIESDKIVVEFYLKNSKTNKQLKPYLDHLIIYGR